MSFFGQKSDPQESQNAVLKRVLNACKKIQSYLVYTYRVLPPLDARVVSHP
jgi:hypothetical protein